MPAETPIVVHEDEVLHLPPGVSLKSVQLRLGSRPQAGAEAYRAAHNIKLKEPA